MHTIYQVNTIIICPDLHLPAQFTIGFPYTSSSKIVCLGQHFSEKNRNENFDEHISKSVPLYKITHDIIVKLSDFFSFALPSSTCSLR